MEIYVIDYSWHMKVSCWLVMNCVYDDDDGGGGDADDDDDDYDDQETLLGNVISAAVGLVYINLQPEYELPSSIHWDHSRSLKKF